MSTEVKFDVSVHIPPGIDPAAIAREVIERLKQ